MPWDWGNAAAGFAGGGIAGGLVGGFAGDKIVEGAENAWQRNFQTSPYEFDEGAFQDPNAEAWQQQLAQGREGIDPQEFRGRQVTLADQLAQQAAGQGPSLANLQLQQGMDRNLAAATAQQATARGNPALAQRNISNQRAQMGQDLAMQSAQTRMQEQMQARQQLTGLLGQGRGADEAMLQYYLSQGMSMDQAQWAAQMELERLRAQQHLGTQAVNVGANQQLLGGILSAGGTLAAGAIA